MIKMTEKLKERISHILSVLDKEYGTDFICYLNYETPWQLLIAVILSAQCTDARVNIVTADLFKKYPTLKDFAAADLKELEQDIHSIGFYHMKAKNIIQCAKRLVEEYGGVVPEKLEDLLTLAGVGRKTANVIRGNIYHVPSIVVDTHVKRISRKLGLTKETEPEKIEADLMKVLPEDHWILWNIHIITLGRTICTARKPDCGNCFLKQWCPACEVPAVFKETEKIDKTTQAAVSETTEAAEENSELDLRAAAGKHHVEINVKDYGTINVELDGDAAPVTVANFLDLAGNGFYDGLTFHRIISGFMIQGGDPLGTGMGGSEREIKGEFDSNGVKNPLSHTRGAISMARAQRKDSASSQFFIVHEDSTFLDGEYACFGYVTDGMDVVDAICEDTKVEDNNGTVAKENQPVIESIKVID